MLRKMLAIIVMAVLTLPFSAIAGEGISYSGSSTIGMSILEEGAVKTFEQKTGIKFASIDQPGSGKGVKALIGGKVNLAGASRALKSKEKKKKVVGTTIGYDAIAVFVHSSNPVENLTKKQIKGIFTGKIKNWKEVGGKDAPITANTEIQGEGRATMLVFQKMAMDGAPYGTGFKEIDLPRDQIVHLAGDPTGICSVSFGLLAATPKHLRNNVKGVGVDGNEPTPGNIKSGKYLIARPLVLATKGMPKGNVKTFIKFMLSPDGQEIVAKHFVSVK
ncbi:MAG: phosphate ABC transporter substrate-binding protein [Planctomycetota bacterium]|jgi:phosphate transport system substrate-binding protein